MPWDWSKSAKYNGKCCRSNGYDTNYRTWTEIHGLGVFFKTVLSSRYILILLSIEYILASLIEMCQG